MRPIGVVLAREYMVRVKGRGFLLTTLAVPLFILGLLALPIFLSGGNSGAPALGLIDRSGRSDRLGEEVAELLRGDGYTILSLSPDDTGRRDGEGLVREGELRGIVVLDERTRERGEALFLGQEPLRPDRMAGVRRAVAGSALAEFFRDREIRGEAEPFLAGGELRFEALEGDGGRRDGSGILLGFGGAMLLYFVLIIYGGIVMRSAMEEKTGRMMEIILSSIRPWELMAGKILGIGGVALTQFALWAVGILLVALFALPALVLSFPALEGVEWAGTLPAGRELLLSLLFFVPGYLIFSGLYAAAGALCSREEDAQYFQMPVTMLLVLTVVLVGPVMEAPGSAMARWVTMIPFLSPVLMPARATTGVVPPGELLLSFALLAGSVPLVIFGAGRVYRIAVLMQGRRPTLPEILRWMRTGRA